MEAGLGGLGVVRFEGIGRVDFDLDLDRLDGRALEPQRLQVIAALAAHPLDLQAARQGVRVVLQGDDPQHRAGVGVDQHDAAAQELRGAGKAAHLLRLAFSQS